MGRAQMSNHFLYGNIFLHMMIDASKDLGVLSSSRLPHQTATADADDNQAITSQPT